MTETPPSDGPPSLPGRLLYSGVLAYMAVDGFKNNDKRVEIARAQGVPLPEFAVPAATAVLLVANVGILLWKYPRVSITALIVFFLGTTPTIHSFWKMDGKQRANNKINFLKNIALIGGALLLLEHTKDE